MATQRDIKKRIKSVTNTRKITSTMEMVSTAKMKKMQQRLEMTKPYELKVNEILANLVNTGVAVSEDPHFKEADRSFPDIDTSDNRKSRPLRKL